MVASVEPQTNVLTNTEVSPVLLYSFHYKPNSILKHIHSNLNNQFTTICL